MKVELEREKAKELNKKAVDLYKEYNAFPMAILDISTGEKKMIYYEANKLTRNEKLGLE